MILLEDEIKVILKAKPPKWLEPAREYHKELKALVLGEDFGSLLSKVEHIEKSHPKWLARKKYARSTKDLNDRVLRPVENVFSANGGSKLIEVPNDRQRQALMNAISYTDGNKSVSKWMANTWKDAFILDPNGIVFMEMAKDASKAYPTYKSINTIDNYEYTGQQLEWVLFKKQQVIKDGYVKTYQRFVDGAKDYTFMIEGDEAKIVDDLTFAHPFGVCPGVILGDVKSVTSDLRVSILDKVIEIEKEYLRDQSILSIVKFLNGFKNLVRPKILCSTCHGTKKQGVNKCGSCDGTGFIVNKDVTDEIILPININNPEQKIPSARDIANWVGLDVETWDQYRKELEILEILIYESVWGTHLTSHDNKTATAKFIDTQPVTNRLNQISSNAEYAEWFIIEMIANFVMPGKNKLLKVSSVNYGKRFIFDDPDTLLELYVSLVQKGTNTVILDQVFNEYLTAKHKGDEKSLRVSLIKSELEPYLHYSKDQINQYFGASEVLKKELFNKWWLELDKEQLNQPKDRLINVFNNYINTNTNYESNDSSGQNAQDA